MRRRMAQGLTIALLVGLGAAQGPTSSWSANHKTRVVEKIGVAGPGPGARPYQVGTASWYGGGFGGKPTASGGPHKKYELTPDPPRFALGGPLKRIKLLEQAGVVGVPHNTGAREWTRGT